jgi:hypothetical protein
MDRPSEYDISNFNFQVVYLGIWLGQSTASRRLQTCQGGFHATAALSRVAKRGRDLLCGLKKGAGKGGQKLTISKMMKIPSFP